MAQALGFSPGALRQAPGMGSAGRVSSGGAKLALAPCEGGITLASNKRTACGPSPDLPAQIRERQEALPQNWGRVASLSEPGGGPRGRQHPPRVRDFGPEGRDPAAVCGGSTPLARVVCGLTEPKPDPGASRGHAQTCRKKPFKT